jgi:hypothetical protein
MGDGGVSLQLIVSPSPKGKNSSRAFKVVVGWDCVSDVGMLYDFRAGKYGFSNCTVMLRAKQITGYNVSRNIVYFGTTFAALVGGRTGGPCPLQDKTGAVISTTHL